MSPSKTWQLDLGAAQLYEEILVAAILGPFARALVAQARPGPGEAVVDVGCGTGAAARRAAELVGTTGSVVAVDVNAAMVRVARSLPAPAGAPIEWLESPAEHLPVSGARINVVLCAQTLQFVQGRELALHEMRRIARPKARVAISVWCSLRENPYFAALSQALTAHIGPAAASGLLAAFSLSDPAELRRVLIEAALPELSLCVHELELELPAPQVFIPRHLAATPMARLYEEAPLTVREQVVSTASELLSPYTDTSGMRVPFRSWFALASL
jgi:SAM-dependent methyltransferase